MPRNDPLPESTIHNPQSTIPRLLACLALFAAALLPSTAPAQPFVYVTHEKSNDVWVISTQTDTVGMKIPVGERPRGVVVSSDGSRIYVANGNSNDISVIVTEKRKTADPAASIIFKMPMAMMRSSR